MKKKVAQRKSRGVVHYAPIILVTIIAAFAMASLVAGEVFNAYETFWWWDDLLHTLAGAILGLIGFLMVYFFNARYQMTINPLFVAVFAFSFAITLLVVWEIFEFAVDAFFGTPMQRWNLPKDAMLIGEAYQGVGLRDTMSDLIVGGLGSLFAATTAFFAFKNHKRSSLHVMRRTVGWLAKKRA